MTAPDPQDESTDEEDIETTWEAMDLGPYLRGEVEAPKPTVGLSRSDGLRMIYPGSEHAILGETESGKTWFTLGCVAAELIKGAHVLYIHYEESDPMSTVERLRLLGVADPVIASRLRFVAPMRAVRSGWLEALLNPKPSLVVHDGVNEAMALHGDDIMAADGAANFRRNLVMPCTRIGAAVMCCDHVTKDRDKRGRDAYGSVHKGNALDGARILLENDTPFGRGMRGSSMVFVTKDRPGHLRAYGRATKTPGKTFMGVLVVDGSKTFEPFEMVLYAPTADQVGGGDVSADTLAARVLADTVWSVIDRMPDHRVESWRQLLAQLRAADIEARDGKVRDALDDLIAAQRLIALAGKRGANGYQAVSTASRESNQ